MLFHLMILYHSIFLHSPKTVEKLVLFRYTRITDETQGKRNS